MRDNTSMANADTMTTRELQTGIKGTVSKDNGSQERSDSPRVNVPPSEAVSSTLPDAKMPANDCTTAEVDSFHTERPRCRRVQSKPIPNPKPTMARVSLLTNNGWSSPSPGLDWMPVMMAKGMAKSPNKRAKCATWSPINSFLRRSPLLRAPAPAMKNATPDMASEPTATSVETTWRVLADTIRTSPPVLPWWLHRVLMVGVAEP